MLITRATGTALLVALALISACSDAPTALTVQTYTSSPDFVAAGADDKLGHIGLHQPDARDSYLGTDRAERQSANGRGTD